MGWVARLEAPASVDPAAAPAGPSQQRGPTPEQPRSMRQPVLCVLPWSKSLFLPSALLISVRAIGSMRPSGMLRQEYAVFSCADSREGPGLASLLPIFL